WYDPVTGRWLSNDPIGISGGLNQYVFCANNPVNFRDPFGLEDINLFDNGFIGIGADPLNKYVKNAPDNDTTFTVGGHGNSSSILDANRGKVLSPKQLADRIRKYNDF